MRTLLALCWHRTFITMTLASPSCLQALRACTHKAVEWSFAQCRASHRNHWAEISLLKHSHLRSRSQQWKSPAAATEPIRPITALQHNMFRIFTWNLCYLVEIVPDSELSMEQHTLIKTFLGADASRDYKAVDFRRKLKKWHWPHVICLPNIKAKLSDAVIEKCRTMLRSPGGSQEPSYQPVFVFPRDKYNCRLADEGIAKYGSCIIVREDVATQPGVNFAEIYWDFEGRIGLLQIPELNLAIVNYSRPSPSDRLYFNPRNGKPCGSRSDFGKIFDERLRDLIFSLELDEWSVVMAGNAKAVLEKWEQAPRSLWSGWSRTVSGCRLKSLFLADRCDDGLAMCDSFRHLHGNQAKFTHRIRALPWGVHHARSDFIFTSSELSQQIIEADILDHPEERSLSDNMPSYITLKIGSNTLSNHRWSDEKKPT